MLKTQTNTNNNNIFSWIRVQLKNKVG